MERFLRALHDTPHALALSLGAPRDQMRRLDVPLRTPSALTGISAMEGRGDVDSRQAGALRAILQQAASCAAPTEQTLVHGDLSIRHLVLDDDARLIGIIDWGDLHLGDPAMDLMIVFLALPAQARERFHGAYGALSADTRALACFRAVVHLGHLLTYAHDVGDDALIAEMRRAAGFLVAT